MAKTTLSVCTYRYRLPIITAVSVSLTLAKKGPTVLHTTPTSTPAVEQFNLDGLKNLLQSDELLNQTNLDLLRQAAAKPHSAELRQELESLEAASGADASETALLKLGLGWYFLGKHNRAAEFLRPLTNNAMACLHLGQVYNSLGQHQSAALQFAAAAKLGNDAIGCTLQQVGATRQAGDVDAAEALLRSIAQQAVSKADYSFQMGCILADQGDTMGGIEYFERAVDMDPHHTQALFWLANESNRMGNDENAILLYERALSKPPVYVGALLNLGLLYEDEERYDQAAFCYRRVLEADSQNERARLFIKDIDASEDQFYDEESAREEAKLRHTLSRPLNDFELSVRSRNCLVQLGMHTLQDLTQISEPELLASRNFGETSLKEIRELLDEHNLHVGQHLESKKPDSFIPQEDMSPEQRSALDRPIADLNLSVRARKCMSRLNITAIAELVMKTPDELLGSKNFGVTSLNEIRGKLTDVGLALRND
jgi:DNA-directed RNA polymerase subunit alpha